MSTFELVIGIILLVFSVFLVVAVLMQEGKSHNLSGTIAGGADTFFGKSKGQTVSRKLSVLTTVVAIIFVVLVCAVYIVSADNKNENEGFWDMLTGNDSAVTTVADDTAAADETTVAEKETEADVTEAETEADTEAETEAAA